MSEEIENENIDHEETDEVICPYCGYAHSDSWGYPNEIDVECSGCGKEFEMVRNVYCDYSSFKK